MIDNRDALDRTPARSVALDCLAAGIAAGDPERVLTDRVGLDDNILTVDDARYDLTGVDRILVVGAGKAAGRQAKTIDGILGDRIDDGAVITTESVDCERIAIYAGDHPIPSERNVAAMREVRTLVSEADAGTMVLVLVSGGGSALLVDPADPVTLAELRAVTSDLLESGAPIEDINAVRKHLSRVKGGRLARLAAPATVLGLAMSDVVGDDPATIASGPTVGDPTTFRSAREALDRADIDPPAGVAERLDAGIDGRDEETPEPGDPALADASTHVIGTAMTAIRAAADEARSNGHEPLVLSSRIRGESRGAAGFHRAVAAEIRTTGHPIEPPAVVLSGGETTVTVSGDGRGGPNQEFALAAAIDLEPGITVGAVDTDGIDGTGPAAGGLVDATSVRDRTAAERALETNDAYGYLSSRDDAVLTGQTGTNLNDLRVIVVSSRD